MFLAICAGDMEVLCSHERTPWFGIPQDFGQNKKHFKKYVMLGQRRGVAPSPLVI